MEAINFPKFSLLPAELRLDIWEEAVREEATNRLVILIDTRVVPIKKLISPLLSVNRESRTRALKMYDTKLNIYRLPSPKPDRHWIGRRNEFLEWKRLGYPPPSQTPQFEGLDELLDELPDLDVFGDIFDDFFASSFKRLDDMDPFMLFHSDTEKIIHNIEERGTDSGTLYVSAEYDAFVITTGLRSLSSPDGITTRKLGFQDDLYALQPFYAEAVARLDKRSLGPELSWKHITSRLPSSTLLAVQTVILAESHCSTEYTYMDPVYETNTFSSILELDYYHYCSSLRGKMGKASHLWRSGIFQGIKFWDHLWYKEDVRSLYWGIVNGRNLNIAQWYVRKGTGEPGRTMSYLPDPDGEYREMCMRLDRWLL